MSHAAHEQNRASWNAATERHLTHKTGLAARLRDGWSPLFPEERELLGDVRGRRVLHVQCNDGTDTLGIAALGADALGVDISDVAIEAARALSAESGIAARFERADVLAWLPDAAARGERFDVAFATYGAIPWVSDLGAWMRGIHDVLAPGGRLVLVEFHPVLYVFEEGWQIGYSYFPAAGGKRWEEGVEDYVGYTSGDAEARGWKNPNACVEFQWTLAEIVNAVVGSGLQLERLGEHPYTNGWHPFPDMRPGEGRRFHPPAGREVPLMLSLAARRPG